MARRIALILLVALVFFSLGLAARPILSRWKHQARTSGTPEFQVFDVSHYQAKSAHFATLHETRKVALLGDSRFANAEWSELLGREDISNRGISGDTTSGLLRRLSTSVPQSDVLCILQVGINDLILGASIEQVVTNYGRIVDFLQTERKARVVMTSVILAAEDQPELNRAIVECNQQLQQLASAKGVTWVELAVVLSPDGYLRAELRSDAVHLNGDGYLRLREVLAPLLP